MTFRIDGVVLPERDGFTLAPAFLPPPPSYRFHHCPSAGSDSKTWQPGKTRGGKQPLALAGGCYHNPGSVRLEPEAPKQGPMASASPGWLQVYVSRWNWGLLHGVAVQGTFQKKSNPEHTTYLGVPPPSLCLTDHNVQTQHLRRSSRSQTVHQHCAHLQKGNRIKGPCQKTAPEDETREPDPPGQTRGCWWPSGQRCRTHLLVSEDLGRIRKGKLAGPERKGY